MFGSLWVIPRFLTSNRNDSPEAEFTSGPPDPEKHKGTSKVDNTSSSKSLCFPWGVEGMQPRLELAVVSIVKASKLALVVGLRVAHLVSPTGEPSPKACAFCFLFPV